MRARFTGVCYACGHYNKMMLRYESEADVPEVEKVPCEHCRALVLVVVTPDHPTPGGTPKS